MRVVEFWFVVFFKSKANGKSSFTPWIQVIFILGIISFSSRGGGFVEMEEDCYGLYSESKINIWIQVCDEVYWIYRPWTPVANLKAGGKRHYNA